MTDMREEWAAVIEQVARDGLPGPRDLDVALDALEAALGIPAETLRGLRDGSLVAVPREPTEAMINAGGASHDHPSVFMGGPSHNGRDKARRIWAAMLDAAQESPR